MFCRVTRNPDTQVFHFTASDTQRGTVYERILDETQVNRLMPAVERWKVSLAAAGQDLMKKLILQPAKRKGITLSLEGAPDVPRNRYVYYKGTQRIDGGLYVVEVVGEVDRSLIDYTGRDSKAQAKKSLQNAVAGMGGGGKGGSIAAVAAAAAAMKKEQEAPAHNGETASNPRTLQPSNPPTLSLPNPPTLQVRLKRS